MSLQPLMDLIEKTFPRWLLIILFSFLVVVVSCVGITYTLKSIVGFLDPETPQSLSGRRLDSHEGVSHQQIICLVCGMNPSKRDSLCVLHCPQVLPLQIDGSEYKIHLQNKPKKITKYDSNHLTLGAKGTPTLKINDISGSPKYIYAQKLYRVMPESSNFEIKSIVNAETGTPEPLTKEFIQKFQTALDKIEMGQLEIKTNVPSDQN